MVADCGIRKADYTWPASPPSARDLHAPTILVFTAHPDDAEFFAGGALAKFIADGARILLVIATGSSPGSFEHDRDVLAAARLPA